MSKIIGNLLSFFAPATMTGATASAAGKSGLVPSPSAGDQSKVLGGSGTWVDLPESADPTIITGNLSDLGTTSKTTLVAAVNEINAGLSQRPLTSTVTSMLNAKADKSYVDSEVSDLYGVLEVKLDAADLSFEEWTFTLENGSTVTKWVAVES